MEVEECHNQWSYRWRVAAARDHSVLTSRDAAKRRALCVGAQPGLAVPVAVALLLVLCSTARKAKHDTEGGSGGQQRLLLMLSFMERFGVI